AEQGLRLAPATGRGRLSGGVCGGAREGQGEVLEERRHGPSRIGAATDKAVLPVDRGGQVSAIAVSQAPVDTRAAASSTRMVRPVACSAATVARQAGRASRERTHSAR